MLNQELDKYFKKLTLDRRNWINVSETLCKVQDELERILVKLSNFEEPLIISHLEKYTNFIDDGYMFLENNQESLNKDGLGLLKSTLTDGLMGLRKIETHIQIETAKFKYIPSSKKNRI